MYPVETMSTITLTTIGVIHTPFTAQRGTPIQPATAQGAAGRVVLRPDLAPALQDLAGFERIWLIYAFDRARPWRPRVVPYRDTVERGLFSTRAPTRPNPIGMSVVRLVSIEGAVLHVQGIDVLDQTPLLDLKPYVPEFDAHPDSRAGWLDHGNHTAQADDRFSR